ncbi:SirB2 family protein [Budviciaceae bacterium BWR-B9]|uniref:SirB2 family protein n=1 Tax=Limnobaculum allomyrinae TaxID=2791986 RepID=A0ABS1ILE2_9GAMM|nr:MULTISPECIES: SirB2 family protein [Limnobaculum]MBK5142565.1 SirB2 family protein [Limnobaculum allomyrinae]MBV7690550.1 SirB2 family protein [Limnobaculum sp. M2-1]
MYIWLKHLHVLTAVISIVLFILRFYWKWRGSAIMQQRWVKITPHLNDTILFVTGIVLIFITHFYPFSVQGTWLTEKLVAVVIYIVLGYIALGKRNRSQMVRSVAFMVAILCLYLIVILATNKMPLFMGYA